MNNWSDEEIKILEDNYLKLSIYEVLYLLPNRSRKAIVQKAERLGMKKVTGNAVSLKKSNGYILARGKDYPSTWRGKWKDGRVYEHNLIWWLCCPDDPILQDEVIHHVNADRADNRIENLQKMKEEKHGYVTRKESFESDFPKPATIDEIKSIIEEIEREL